MDGKQGLSKPTFKTPLLRSLKQCVKKIENEVGELKKSYNAISIDEDESEASSNLEKILSATKTNLLRHDCEKLKSSLKYSVKRTKCYYYDMEDLTLDVEDEIAYLEKHLKTLGYEPPELDTSSSSEESKPSSSEESKASSSEESKPSSSEESNCEVEDNYCENIVSESDLSLTPELPTTVSIPQKRTIEKVSSSSKISEADLSLTPEFPTFSTPQIRTIEKASSKKEPVTPELSAEVKESEKKVLQYRHILDPSPLPFPNLGSAIKLGDVARRLDF